MWAQPSFQAASSVGNHALAVSSRELPVSRRRRRSRLWDGLGMQTPEASRHALTVGQEIQLPVFTTVNSGNSGTVDSFLPSRLGASALRRAAPPPPDPSICLAVRSCVSVPRARPQQTFTAALGHVGDEA